MEKDESSSEPRGEVQPEQEQQEASCDVPFFQFSIANERTCSYYEVLRAEPGACERRGSRASC
jgi:hypothetical protein